MQVIKNAKIIINCLIPEISGSCTKSNNIKFSLHFTDVKIQ